MHAKLMTWIFFESLLLFFKKKFSECISESAKMVTELHIFRFAENAHCGWLGSFAQFTQPVVQPAVFIQLVGLQPAV